MNPILRECLGSGCKRLVDPTKMSRCPDCQEKEAENTAVLREETEPWRYVYDTPEWGRARRAALDRDGHRCRFVWRRGGRCPSTQVSVHHTTPLRDLWTQHGKTRSRAFLRDATDVHRLASLCPEHHRMLEPRVQLAPTGRGR